MKNIEIEELEKELDVIDEKIANGVVSYEDFDAVKKHRKEIIARLQELGSIVKDDMTLHPVPKN